ncbi:MAG: BMP family lipoprotein [Chloroflexota bacterium]
MRTAMTALLSAALVFMLFACEPEVVNNPSAATATTLAQVIGQTPIPSPTATSTPIPSPTPTPTQAPIPTAVNRTLSVALVGDGVADGNRLASALAGLERAKRQSDLETISLKTPPDKMEATLTELADKGYELIIATSADHSLMVAVARAHPQTKFVTFGPAHDPAVPNLVGLVFAEDQAGFLAGVLAGWLTKADMVGFVGASPTVDVVKFRKGYEHGVQYVNSKAVVMGKYMTSFAAPKDAAAEAKAQMDEGADVMFAVGGDTAVGALQATADRGVAGLAAEQDVTRQQSTLGPAIAASALVNVDVAVQQVIEATKSGSFTPGSLYFNVNNGGISLAPNSSWKGQIPDGAIQELGRVLDGLRSGTVDTRVVILGEKPAE